MTERFFVYGTLKVGGYFAAGFDKVRTSVKPATLKGHDLYRIGKSSFPVAIPGDGFVIGEVHEYTKADTSQVLKELDRIEGYVENNEENSLYIRKKLPITLNDGSEIEAYVYIFNQDIFNYGRCTKINNGIWEL